MSEKREMSVMSSGLTRWAMISALTSLAAFGTLLIRIPIPGTTGYFNLGDVFVVWAALWLGPVAGLIVGALGPMVADAIGYPQFILATLVTKGLEGLIVGLLAGRGGRVWQKACAAAAGASMIVIGYFLFEAVLYPKLGRMIPLFATTDYAAAVMEVGPNLLQAVFAVVLGVAMWRATSRQ